MNERKTRRRPTPALVVAMIALFVALGGTAGAVVTATVPLAKRALVADNAKKVGGVSAAQLGGAAVALALKESPAGPRPASTAAGLVAVKTGAVSLGAGAGGEYTVSCDAGQKVLGGGFTSNGPVFSFDSFPASDASWKLYLVNGSESAGASVTLYATCLK
jgi:hypothetical protein